MTFMTRIFPHRHFHMSQFDLAPLAFELRSESEEGELLLDRIVSRSAEQPGILALAAPLPTAGELHASIERHLRATDRPPASAPGSARDELQTALAELRRSLG